MNNDLISRSELKKAFENLASDDYNEPLWYESTVFSVIGNAPTIEPDAIKELGSETLAIIKDILPQIVEQSARIVRPSADWIEFKYGLYYCSNCFDKVDKDIDRIEHLVAKRDLSPFCPFCGSLMKGKGKAYD